MIRAWFERLCQETRNKVDTGLFKNCYTTLKVGLLPWPWLGKGRCLTLVFM
jgi:hypothetical protein